MGRPEPCVLFSQTFAHPQLDEYVDEVLFNESIVITACEFIEQNASSASSVVTLVGATSPPSFALEVFVQCEGEPRFRRLCQPFLYSHSSSNMLEVEAVVTNHLVVRGSYRSLTLVVYGNTAEDLGQFNIEFDLDSSLANLVCSPSEGKLEDLPPALHSTKLMLEEAIFSPKLLSLLTAEPNVSSEVEQFLELIIKIFGASVNGDALHKVLSTVISTVSSYVSSDLGSTAITWNPCKRAGLIPCKKELKSIFIEAKNELEELHKLLKHEASSSPVDSMGEGDAIESEAEVVTSPAELLPDLFSWYYLFVRNCPKNGRSLSQNKSMVVGLSIVLLLCSGKETCFHFVNGGGMEQLVRAFDHRTQKSTSVRLMLLGVIERATRYATGCEGFLGWWPREDEIVPVGSSEGYSQILKLLLQKQRHDVASLASYLLHRLRFYEVASRYESAVLSLLAGLSDVGKVTNVSLIMLDTAKLQLKQLLKLLNSCGPIEDPSPVANASRTLILGQSDGILSYRATINLIVGSSDCCFSKFDIDPHLLPLLKERGFLALSAALLSSSVLRSEKGHALDLFLNITSLVEAILLSLLLCRSGLVFLLLQPEIAAALVYSLKGVEEMNKEECVPLRYASVLINKGFFCRPQDVGTITELHLRAVNAIDRLLASTPQSEDLLWVLWELCGLSRSDSGRQALLALRHFPEAISVLMEALRSAKNPDGSSPLNLAIFHSAAEIFEVIVTDSTASSLGSWIEHSVELHNVLHDPSPGSNRKDAPTRLLEWVDAGVVYQRNGAIGLLRYAAVLASNGDASSILVSDSMDIENAAGDSGSGSDVQVTENLLGKLVLDKGFDGHDLRDSPIAQLTTAFRILSSVSENLSVAGALYEEGAVTLVYVVLLNCKFTLEGSPRAYAHLVDEGGEGNSMLDLLAERGREQSLVDLMIPCLLLLNTLLHKLQEAKEQHRNTKLLNALLRLHREVSPKLAACVADLSCPYPSSALGLGAICHLIVSALACWPVFGWTPDLFHCLLESVQATSSLALGPKEACSLLCLLGDLFPEEGVWLWKQGMPSLSALKALAIATLLGPPKERLVFWYLEPAHVATLLSRLTPLLDKIAEIILHFAFTALVVIQDMLRVLIIRIACQNIDSAAILLRPIIAWIHDHVSDAYSLSDTESFKVFRLLEFLASLLEHPSAKTLLLKEGVAGILIKALDKCYSSLGPEVKMTTESRTRHFGFSLLNWCIPVFKSVILLCESETLQLSGIYDDKMRLAVQDCFLILHHLLRFCQVLPVGKELLASLFAFKELSCCSEGKSAFVSISTHFQSSSLDELELERGREQDGNDGVIDNYDWRRCPPLLYCWRNLFRSISGRDWISTCAIEAVGAMSLGALYLCFEGKSLNLERIAVLKCLFGLPFDCGDTEQYPEESLKDFSEMISLLDSRIVDAKQLTTSDVRSTLSQVKEMAKLLLVLFRKPTGSIKVDDIIPNGDFSFLSSDILDHFTFSSKSVMTPICDDTGSSSLQVRKSDDKFGKTDDLFSLNGLSEKFLWDCPDPARDGSSMSSIAAKRKMASTELPNRRARVDSSGAESTVPNAFPRGVGPPTASSVPTRRDTFRQRKPNTSRPPSMHVDDYVARERNIDGGSSGSNVVSSVHRGITGGRPPSIHVDEFMARQRERQASVPMAGAEGVAQTSNVPPENNVDPDKVDRSRQLKVDLDDDLQEINIVFDDEESESDDKLPFPQPDDNLQPAPVVVEGNSPRSIVEETGSDTIGTNVSNLGTPSASNVDENTQSEFSSRRSVSRSEKPLSREESISSERKFIGGSTDKPMPREKSDVSKHSIPVMASKGHDSATTNFSGFPPPFYKGSASPGQLLGDARGTSSNFYQRDSPQHTATVQMASPSQGLYNQKLVPNQPPLPPMPPPPNVSRVPSHNAEHVQSHSATYGHNVRDKQPPLPPGFPSQAFEVSGSVAAHNYAATSNPSPSSSAFMDSLSDSSALQLHADYLSTFNTNSATLFGAQHTMFDSKYSWASVSSASRLHDEINPATSGLAWPPPLPPTPPPFSSSSVIQSSVKSSASQSPGYNQTNAGTIQLPMNSNSPSNDARLGSFSTAGGNLTSYSPPQLVPPLLNSRPSSIPVSLFSSPTIHQGQNLPSLAHSVSTPPPSILSMQPRPQLQPLQPPQPSHPHPQHLRPPTQVSQQQSELSLLQGPIQVQSHPFQIHQQPHIAPIHVYYPTQQHESLANAQQQQQVDLSQPQPMQLQGDSASQQQQDSEMSLQQYFASPEAIQSLISDREKLCQLLEHHPKLMQMLQERLGQ